MSRHDPVVGAIAVDLADFVRSPPGDKIFPDEYLKRWACAAAAFYHRAEAQDERYGVRPRDAFRWVCTSQATAASPQ